MSGLTFFTRVTNETVVKGKDKKDEATVASAKVVKASGHWDRYYNAPEYAGDVLPVAVTSTEPTKADVPAVVFGHCSL